MLRTAQLSSKLFNQVIGRAQPRLPHPTANDFDPTAWREALTALAAPAMRDLELAHAAFYFHREVARLHEGPLKAALADLTSDTIIKLAVAESNRGHLITARRLEKAMSAYAAGDEVLLNSRPVIHTGASPLQGNANADDVNTFIGDTLPHWFHQAANAKATATDAKAPLGRAAQVALMFLSLERSLRGLWHDVLWEGCSLGEGEAVDDAPVLTPSSLAEETLWAAWHGRFDSLGAVQAHLRVAELRAGRLARTSVLKTTVTRLVRSGRTVRCRFGRPDASSDQFQTFSMDNAESAYIGIFLDEPMGGGVDPVTPRRLMHAWFVLRDMAKLLIRDIPRTEIRSARDMDALAAGLPKQTVWVAIHDALGLNDEQTTEVMGHLVTDAANVGEAFRQGLWHRPLVARPGTDELLFVLPILISGAPIRRVERWLVASGRADDLSNGPRGLAFEAHVRDTIGESLTGNERFKDVGWTKHAIARKGGGEEVDAVFRFGRTVLVCEIKCLLVPAEAIEHYGHIKKLEAAAEQALRKTAWLKTRPDVLEAAIGALPADVSELTFVPMVVLNHGIGLGLDIDGCLVTDLHFLDVYLSAGVYTASNLIGPFGAVPGARTRLYVSQQDAEERLRATFAAPPGLTKFFPAVIWRDVAVPTSNGGVMRAPAYDIDESKLIRPEEQAIAALLDANRKRTAPTRSAEAYLR